MTGQGSVVPLVGFLGPAGRSLLYNRTLESVGLGPDPERGGEFLSFYARNKGVQFC